MHLITPSEIVSGVLTSAESVASGSLQNVKAEAKHFDERVKSNC
jgi:enhancer of mRNA-decapping protein 4